MGRSKHHHFISRFYLNGFADRSKNDGDKRFIWQYEKDSTSIIPVSTRDAGVERGFRSFRDEENQTISEPLEKWFGQFEDEAAPVLRKIKDRQQLTDEDRAWIAGFIALLYVGTPNWKKELDHFADRKSDSSESREDKKLYKSEIFRNVLFAQVFKESSQILAGKLMTMKWFFVESEPGCRFVTSDNPVVTVNPKLNPFPSYNRDITSPDFEIDFPLTKYLALVAHARALDAVYIPPKKDVIRRINYQTVVNAARFVYTSFRNRDFNERFVQKYIRTAPTFRS